MYHLYNLVADIAFKDGKIGDYLFLGNMVYTVRNFVLVVFGFMLWP